ncbi:MAG: transglutaminase TgpA family protein [Phycisphaerales bacterium]
MTILRWFPTMVYAVVILAIASFFAARGEVSLLLIAGGLAAVSWYVCEGPRGLALPRMIASLLILAVSVGVIPDLANHRDDVVGVIGRYAVWLSLIKLFERKRAADYAQLLMLSLVLMLAGALQTRSLFYGLGLIVYSVLTVLAVLLYQLYAGNERALATRMQSVPVSARSSVLPPLRPVFGPGVRRQFLLFTIFVAAIGIIASTIFFMAFPRHMGHGMLQQLMTQASLNRTGFVDQISLKTGARIGDSKTPVFQVRVLAGDGKPLENGQPIYLRGGVLEEYDAESFTWAMSRSTRSRTREGTAASLGFTALGVGRMNVGAQLDEYTIEVTPLVPMNDVIFAPASPVALSMASEMDFTFNQRTHTLTANARRAGSYTVRTVPRPSPNLLVSLNGGLPVVLGTLRPYDNAKVRELASSILRDAGLAAEQPRSFPERGTYARDAARACAAFLGSFTYTLDLSDVVIEGDPIEAFLLSFKRGHCEYFASALVAMLQSLGIEARLVTGFLAAEFEGDGYYRVRESHAHAWTEVHTTEFGWERVDPTPASVIDELSRVDESLAGRARGVYEMLDSSWIQNIVDFDGAKQTTLAQGLSIGPLDWLSTQSERFSEWLRMFIRRFGWAGGMQLLAISAAVAVALLILVRVIRRARRVRKMLQLQNVHGEEYRRLLRSLSFYIDMLDLLQRGDLAKPDWQPPRAWADVLHGSRPDVAMPVAALADLFYTARFGHQPLDTADEAAAAAELDRLAGALGVRRH